MYEIRFASGLLPAQKRASDPPMIIYQVPPDFLHSAKSSLTEGAGIRTTGVNESGNLLEVIDDMKKEVLA